MSRFAAYLRRFDPLTVIPWLVGLALIAVGVALAARDLENNQRARNAQEVGFAVAVVMLSAGIPFLVVGVVAGILTKRRPTLAAAIIVGTSTIVAFATVQTKFWTAGTVCEVSNANVGGACWPVGTAPTAATLSLFASWACGFAIFALVVRRRAKNLDSPADGQRKPLTPAA